MPDINNLKALSQLLEISIDYLLDDEQFTFVLNQVDQSGEFIRTIQSMKNDVDGKAVFDGIIYSQADMGKTYYYTISELKKDSLTTRLCIT